MKCSDFENKYYAFNGPVSTTEIIQIAKDILKSQICRAGPKLNSSQNAKEYLLLKMSRYEREVFACLFLNKQFEVIAVEELFWGTIDRNTIHIREIIKRALFHNAAAIIIAHNHPSGCTVPSQEDHNLTSKIKNALELVEIRLLDHFIVGSDSCISFADEGIL